MFGSYIDELVSYTVAKPRHTAVRYYTSSNNLYSIATTTNTAGAVVERYSYNAYGMRTVKNSAGVTLAKSAVGQDRGFTSYKLDAETGLYYARARMYSPKLGRFVRRDPVGYIDGFNLYGAYFCPNFTDYSGYSACADFVEEILSVVNNHERMSLAGKEMFDKGWALRKLNVKEYPIDGFKEPLVDNGQRGDVYKHVWCHGGCELGGTTGSWASYWGSSSDISQLRNDPSRLESVTELRDNAAGLGVGWAIKQHYLGGLTQEQLRARLKSILCDDDIIVPPKPPVQPPKPPVQPPKPPGAGGHSSSLDPCGKKIAINDDDGLYRFPDEDQNNRLGSMATK